MWGLAGKGRVDCSVSCMINCQGLTTASGSSCNPSVIRAAPCSDCSKTPVIQNERTLCSKRIRFWCCKVDIGGSFDGSLARSLIGICVSELLWREGIVVSQRASEYGVVAPGDGGKGVLTSASISSTEVVAVWLACVRACANA